MMQASDVLNILRMKNQQDPRWINRNLYRLLYNPSLHIMAYERLKSKPGNMTPGSDGRTLDGYGWETIQEQIQLLRDEQYQPTPVRRQYIPKKKGYRPLGIPSPQDKVIQECIRFILEAIYEPGFHDNSHGFRPGRSCHTALESLRKNWTGTKWVIEVDIANCFESVDHHRLLDILRERIQDDRFINLIRKFLTAGYLENWEYHKTYSGTPQGSVISPILTNIYLDKLDCWLAQVSDNHTRGKTRRPNMAYLKLAKQRKALLVQGETSPQERMTLQPAIRRLNRQILQTPSYDYHDPFYTRVKFLRYADDVRIGVIGSKALAQYITDQLNAFLKDELKLTLNREKTRITHLATEHAHFLGYQFKTASPRFRRRNLQTKGSPHNVVQTVKTASGNITLLMPLREISKKLKKYLAHGQPRSMPGFTNQPVEHIIDHYNGRMRGWYNYYQLAENVCKLNYARYVLQYSLAKTLAHKERSSVGKIFRKYGKDLTYEKPNGRKVHFFNQPLKQVKTAWKTSNDVDIQPTWYPRRTRTRLLDYCAICGSSGPIQMHHVRHIRKRGQAVTGFTLFLVAINRKQLPVCKTCHQDIHRGKYDGESLNAILEQLERTSSSQMRGSSSNEARTNTVVREGRAG
jgi:group II intron reverse transcriptase/maturase